MATLRQKNAAKKFIESVAKGGVTTKGEILKATDYSTSTQNKPEVVFESEGFKEALSEFGFNEDSAKKVVKEIMLNKKAEPHARLKATDQVFKVEGSYAPERHVNLNLEISSEEKEVARKALEAIND